MWKRLLVGGDPCVDFAFGLDEALAVGDAPGWRRAFGQLLEDAGFAEIMNDTGNLVGKQGFARSPGNFVNRQGQFAGIWIGSGGHGGQDCSGLRRHHVEKAAYGYLIEYCNGFVHFAFLLVGGFSSSGGSYHRRASGTF